MTKYSSITGQTRLVGLVGWPVEHSLSPAMHNAAFETLGLDWSYVPLPVPSDQLEAAVRGLAALGFCGANVTVPHKRAVIPYLNAISPHAEKMGAVNTIVVGRDNSGQAILEGLNTDKAGFVRSLEERGFKPRGKRALVLGAGGAARAVVFGLLDAGATQLTLLNRTVTRAEALVAELQKHYPHMPLTAASLTPAALEEHAAAAELLVNSTPIGMWPQIERSPWPEHLPLPAHLTVYDLVYRPRQTRLLRQAKSAGARTIDGLGMLVFQAALAFELWTDHWPPMEVLWNAASKHLEGAD